MRIAKDDTLGMVLAPGGFYGANSAAFAAALYEKGLTPDYLFGCSVGALNCASLVQRGHPNQLMRTWREVEKKGPSYLFDPVDPIRRIFDRGGEEFLRNNIFSDRGLRDLVKPLDMNKIVASDIEFRVAVRNENKNRLKIFSNQDQRFRENPELFREVIIASASIPGIFPPVRVNGESYCDGEVLELSDAVSFGCDKILVLLNKPIESEDFGRSSQFFWDRIMDSRHYYYIHHLRDFIEMYSDKVFTFYPEEKIIPSASSFVPEENHIIKAIERSHKKARILLEEEFYIEDPV